MPKRVRSIGTTTWYNTHAEDYAMATRNLLPLTKLALFESIYVLPQMELSITNVSIAQAASRRAGFE
jgi:hypothetical protein